MKSPTQKQIGRTQVSTVIERTAGGAVVVKPGPVVVWLTPKEFAAQAGCCVDAVYRAIGGPDLPESFISCAGARRYLIQADGVEHFKSFWRNKRGLGA